MIKYNDFTVYLKRFTLSSVQPEQEAAIHAELVKLDEENKAKYAAWYMAYDDLMAHAKLLYGVNSSIIDYLRKHRASLPPVLHDTWSNWIKKVHTAQKKAIEEKRMADLRAMSLQNRRNRAEHNRQMDAERVAYAESQVQSD